ncbi:MAG: hypothetical protein RID53_23190 [Coleofasciculus sp. B1-GNL1-01]|uniref:hypothetical protein n=1 Tax=Coleofasciculus sp. B1-GNL1-01 TaxID=3068484 RepID=UPI0032FC79CD
MSLENWTWIPNKSFGLIKFNTPIEIYTNNIGVFLSDDNATIGWKTYKVPDENISIYVEDGIVVAVATYEKLYFKGINLIGISQTKLIEILEVEPDEVGTGVLYEDGDVQTPLDFDPLGLQVWISDCVVVSASLSDDL